VSAVPRVKVLRGWITPQARACIRSESVGICGAEIKVGHLAGHVSHAAICDCVRRVIVWSSVNARHVRGQRLLVPMRLDQRLLLWRRRRLILRDLPLIPDRVRVTLGQRALLGVWRVVAAHLLLFYLQQGYPILRRLEV